MNSILKKISSCKVIKGLIICVISFTIIWFGMAFGPDENSVEAKVFERLTFYTRSMPQYLFDEQSTSEPRKAMVNGNTSYFTVGKSKDDISKILNFYAKRYPPQPVGKIDDHILKKVSDRQLKQCLIKMNKFLECMSENQHVRMEGEDFGFFGAIEFHDPDLMLGSEKFLKKYQNAMTTGEFGKIGTGRIVIALKNPDTQETRIINLWTDRDFNLKKFLPDTSGDMGGKDIPGIPRYPGSRRLLAIEQENTLTYDTLVSYEGGGGVVGNILFYHSRMEDAGWKTDPIFEKVVGEQSMENFMFYTRQGRECTIHIQEDEYTGKIITTITNREMKNS